MTDEMIFAAAVEQPGPAERVAYLDTACGTDTAQRKRIDALLAAHDKAGRFLERPAVAPHDPSTAPTRAFHDPAKATGDDTATRTHGGVTEDDEKDALGFLEPPGRPDSLGRIGHYEVLEVLGHGGFGIVYRAFDDVLHRVVAVKVLAPSLATTSPARKRFLREARAAGAVQHENIVRIHAIEEQPLPHLVMEFIPGETLQQRLDRTGPLDVAEVVRIGRQVAEGLAAAHANGLIHRDIKPSNILIDSGPESRVKITDFGLARAADDASLTRSGTVAGTPLYMAPEQAKGETLDHRADLFSLGSVLYVICTGRPPFRANSTLAVLKRVAEEDPRPIREIIPEVPKWLCRIVEKLHAKDPAERFQTAREVADVLADCERQLLAHKELKDFARIPETMLKRRPGTRKWKWVAAATLALFGLIWALVAFDTKVYRFVANRGELIIEDMAPDTTVSIHQGGELIYTATDQNYLALPAHPATEIRVYKRFSSREVFRKVVTVGRGDRVTINLGAELAAVEERNRVAVQNPLGEIGKPPSTSTTPTPDALAREETAKLNGEWIVRQASVDQSPLLGSEQTEMKLTLRDGKFILPIRDDSGYSWALTGTYDLDAVKKRLAFKIRGQDDPVPCEYRIERDKLVLDFPEPKNNEGKTGSTLMLAPDVRRATQQNLYKLGMAMHNHMGSQTDSLPLPAIAKDGKPLLSWRVALLPHLDQEALYLKFKLDEPWDSEHNKKLIEKMPKVFSIPGLATPPGETHYRVFVGPGTAFEPRPAGAKGIRFADFDDRLSETILVAEAAESVIWTKPDELPYDPKAPLPKLGVYASGPHMVMGDGSVVRLSPQATEKGIRGAIVRNDGEVLSSQMLHRIPLRGPAVHLELHHYTEPMLSPLDREELAKLKGEWLALSAEFEKKPIPSREIDELSIRFGDGEFEFQQAGKPSEGWIGTYRIESEKKHLLLFFKGQTVPVRCPYRVTGDRLGLDFAGLPDDGEAGGKKEHNLRVHERMRSQNNLKQLAHAMNNYSDVNKAFPPAAIVDRKAKDGKPLLSWRVAILPFIEQKELYEQFKLDEPWDSEHNKKLIARMPKVFETPGIKTPEPGMSHYRVFVGPGTAFEPRPDREHGFAPAEIADGTSNTLLIAEAAEPVIWTKPDDLPFDPKKPLAKLGVNERAIHIVYCDGKVVALAPDVSDTVLKGLITRNGGESVSAPIFSPEPPPFPPLYLEFRRADKGGKPAVKEPPNPAVIQPLRDAVAAKARTLETTKTRYEVGAVSKIDLLNAEAELTDSRVALAEAEGDAATTVARLEELVKQRQEERELIALRVNSGLERSEVLNQADTRLANAKVRLAKAKPAPGAAPAPRPKP